MLIEAGEEQVGSKLSGEVFMHGSSFLSAGAESMQVKEGVFSFFFSAAIGPKDGCFTARFDTWFCLFCGSDFCFEALQGRGGLVGGRSEAWRLGVRPYCIGDNR